jgi:hypothetical protein
MAEPNVGYVPVAPTEQSPRTPLTEKKVTISLAAAKQDIRGDVDALEHAAREEARRRTLTRERQGVLAAMGDTPRRIVATTLSAADYAKRKDEAIEALAAAGMQVEAFSNDYRRVAAQEARRWRRDEKEQQREEDRQNGVSSPKRLLAAAVRAGRSSLGVPLLEQRDLDRRADQLTAAARFLLFNETFDPAAPDAAEQLPEGISLDAVEHVRVYPDLIERLKRELTGDAKAAAGLARKLTDETGDNLLNGALGEMKRTLSPTRQMETFFKEQLLLPALQEALTTNGTLSDDTWLRLTDTARNFFFSQEFAQWRQAQGWETADFTIVTDVIEQACRIASLARDHMDASQDVATYARDLLGEMDIAINAGVVQTGDLTLDENWLERKVASHVDRRNVHSLFTEIAGGNEPDPVVPEAYRAATEQVGAWNTIVQGATVRGRLGTTSLNVALGGLGYAASQSLLSVGLPLIGSAAVGGLRGSRQGEIAAALHEIDSSEGVQFAPDRRALPGLPTRTERLQRAEMPKMETGEVIERLTTARQDIQEFPTTLRENAAERHSRLLRTLGILSEIDARRSLAQNEGEILFRSSGEEMLKSQMTQIDILASQVRQELITYLSAGQNISDLNGNIIRIFNINYLNSEGEGVNRQVDEVIERFSQMRQMNLLTGHVLQAGTIDAAFFAVGHRDLSVRELREEIAARERNVSMEQADLLDIPQTTANQAVEERRRRRNRQMRWQLVKHLAVPFYSRQLPRGSETEPPVRLRQQRTRTRDIPRRTPPPAPEVVPPRVPNPDAPRVGASDTNPPATEQPPRPRRFLPTPGLRDRLRERLGRGERQPLQDTLEAHQFPTIAQEQLTGTDRLPPLVPLEEPAPPPAPEPPPPQPDAPPPPNNAAAAALLAANTEHLTTDQRRQQELTREQRFVRPDLGPTDPEEYARWYATTSAAWRQDPTAQIFLNQVPAAPPPPPPPPPGEQQQGQQQQEQTPPRTHRRITATEPGLVERTPNPQQPLPPGRLHGEVTQMGLNGAGEVVLTFADGRVSFLPNGFTFYNMAERKRGNPQTITGIITVDGEEYLEITERGRLSRTTSRVSLEQFVSNLNSGRTIEEERHPLHIGRLPDVPMRRPDETLTRENPGVLPMRYESLIPGIITDPITGIGLDPQGELLIAHGETLWRGNMRGSVLGEAFWYRDPRPPEERVRLTIADVDTADNQIVVRLRDAGDGQITVPATEFFNSINEDTPLGRYQITWPDRDPGRTAPLLRAPDAEPEPAPVPTPDTNNVPDRLPASERGNFELSAIVAAIERSAAPNHSRADFDYFVPNPTEPFTIDPAQIDDYTVTEPFFEILDQLPDGRLNIRASRTVAPFAYEDINVPDPIDSTNPMYEAGEEFTNRDGGLLALAAAAAETPEGRVALYTTLADTILTIHEQRPNLLDEWVTAQDRQQTPFGSNSYNVLESFDNGRPVEERLLQLDNFDGDWRNRIAELRTRFTTQPITLQPYHLRWMEFLAHSVNVTRIIREMQAR